MSSHEVASPVLVGFMAAGVQPLQRRMIVRRRLNPLRYNRPPLNVSPLGLAP
jgi:hypothetical protein